MNLLETGGVNEKNQAGEKSVIQFAQDKRLGVLINRPLNAILKNRLVRLAEVKSRQAVSAEQISRGIEELISSEDLLTHQVLPTLNLEPSRQAQLTELIGVGTILQNHWQRFGTYERWQELQSHYFIPRFRGAIQVLMQGEEISREISAKVESYQEKFEAVFRAITSVYQQAAAEQSAQIKAGVSSADSEWAEAETLSQMALRALRSTPGITTVLIGMRSEHYVEDVLAELGRPVERQDRTASWRKLRNIEV
jgi:hypothetical protein